MANLRKHEGEARPPLRKTAPLDGAEERGTVGHQEKPRPDDGEDAQPGGGVGHRHERVIEGVEHGPLLLRGRAGRDQRDPGEQQDGREPSHQTHLPAQLPEPLAQLAGACWHGRHRGRLGFGLRHRERAVGGVRPDARRQRQRFLPRARERLAGDHLGLDALVMDDREDDVLADGRGGDMATRRHRVLP